MKRTEIRKRHCPKCKARPYQPCSGPGGLRQALHRERQHGELDLAPSTLTRPGRLETEAALVERALIWGIQEGQARIRALIARTAELCDSPIERVFAAHVQAHGFAFPALYKTAFMRPDPPHDRYLDRDTEWNNNGLYVIPQATLGSYRVDFLFVEIVHLLPNSFTVVELDGHDFHEKTKEQAARDKARDRYLTQEGCRVIRFSGAEIWANPRERANEALNIALGLNDRIMGR